MIQEYLPYLLMALLALVVGVAGLGLSTILHPRKLFSKSKYEPYECGVDQVNDPHRPFALKFYTFALLFILFDIETIFLLPWAMTFKDTLGPAGLISVFFFLTLLGLGLFYILKTKALEWD